MNKLISDMKRCDQTTGLSVWEHGKSVHSYFMDLYNHAMRDKDLDYEWKLPEWALDKKLWGNIFDLDTIKNYQVFHDCGKPYCLVVDNDGRRHFPNHANVSAETWKKHGHPN